MHVDIAWAFSFTTSKLTFGSYYVRAQISLQTKQDKLKWKKVLLNEFYFLKYLSLLFMGNFIFLLYEWKYKFKKNKRSCSI